MTKKIIQIHSNNSQSVFLFLLSGSLSAVSFSAAGAATSNWAAEDQPNHFLPADKQVSCWREGNLPVEGPSSMQKCEVDVDGWGSSLPGSQGAFLSNSGSTDSSISEGGSAAAGLQASRSASEQQVDCQAQIPPKKSTRQRLCSPESCCGRAASLWIEW